MTTNFVFMLMLILFIREIHPLTISARQAKLQLQLKPLYETLLKSSDLQALRTDLRSATPYRLNIFYKNVQRINNHNDARNTTFQEQINKFALLTQEQFQQHYFGLLRNNQPIRVTRPKTQSIRLAKSHHIDDVSDQIHQQVDQDHEAFEDHQACQDHQVNQDHQAIQDHQIIQDHEASQNHDATQTHEISLRGIRPEINFSKFFILPINWKSRGKVTPVKNQGACGSCWAFSAIGALESAFLIQHRISLSLSEQQLVDCSRPYGNYGCSGGWQYRAFNYIRAKRITTSAVYPYKAKDGRCVYRNDGFCVRRYLNATNRANNCAPLRSALYRRPQSVAVDASGWGFYKSGIYNKCPSSPSLNHAVLLIGFDWSRNWIIKNSWGTSWGNNGYITLRRENCCGICNMPGSAPYI